MRRLLCLLILLIVASPAYAAALGIEVGPQLYDHTVGGATLYLLDVTQPAHRLLGQDSYYQFNLGGWTGPDHASTLGIARGVRWRRDQVALSASLGVSAISRTTARLSTAFEFYEQLLLARRIGPNQIGIGVRHWSNGGIKHPNDGMTFLALQWSRSW